MTDLREEHFLETYRSLISISLEGFRYLALINGGAVVALIAYLGNTSSGGRPVPDLRAAMLGFIVGLVSCGFAMLFAYLTQLWLLNEGQPVRTFMKSHSVPLHVAIALSALSLVAFCFGAWSAVSAFT